MKFILTHRNHEPSPSFAALIKQRIESLREALQIDEARVFVEHQPDASPAFRITAHLVTPGPDVLAEAIDHTLRAALDKMIGQLEARIDHRQQKRTRREPAPLRTSAPVPRSPGGARI